MKPTITPTRLLPIASTTLIALLVVSCGGGGGGDSGVDATTPTAQVTTMSGSVVKGPVGGATLRAFAVTGGTMGVHMATATTDANGAFMMSLGNYAGPVMLQMHGGTYTDEASGASMAMGAGDIMTAALPTVAAGSAVTGIAVTPLTAMAQAMAQRMAGGLTDANIAAANAAVGSYFMVGDILLARPMNPLVTGSGTGASQGMMNYGMVLAAMSQYAKGAGMPASSSFVTAMMNDASDGVLDGMAGAAPVSMGGGGMGGGMMGGGMMQTNAGRIGLATAMTDFINSSLNQSGVSATHMAPLMQQLRTSSGHMR